LAISERDLCTTQVQACLSDNLPVALSGVAEMEVILRNRAHFLVSDSRNGGKPKKG